MDERKLIKILEPFEKREDLLEGAITTRLYPASIEGKLRHMGDPQFRETNSQLKEIFHSSKLLKNRLFIGGRTKRDVSELQINGLGPALIDNVIIFGSAEKTVKTFLSALRSGRDAIFNVFIFSGFLLTEKITLGDGWELCPFRQMGPFEKYCSQDVYETLRTKGILSSFSKTPEDVGFCCLIQKKPEEKIITDDRESDDLENEIDKVSPDFIYLLSAIALTPVFIHWSYSRFSNENPFSFLGAGSTGYIYDLKPFKSVKNKAPIHEKEISKYFLGFKQLSEKHRDLIILASHRLSQSLVRTLLPDRILELGIALELVLLNDKTHLELKYRLAQRGAWFLFPNDLKARLETERVLRKFYDYRSDVVHNGFVKENNRPKAIEALQEAQKYLSLAILKITNRGSFPDAEAWTLITLGDETENPSPTS